MGGWIVGLFWLIPLLFSFVAVLVAVGTAVGWPIMLATQSVEGTDAFDGFNRQFSFLLNRFWHYAGYWLMTAILGSLGLSLILFIFSMMTQFLSHTLHHEHVIAMAAWQEPPTEIASDISFDPTLNSIVQFWFRLFACMLMGVVFSYFWAAVTITYFLLRKIDDATEFDQVCFTGDLLMEKLSKLVDERDEQEHLPTTGVASSELSTPLRPIGKLKETTQDPELPEPPTKEHDQS